jgi:phage terminase large subunit
VARPERPEALAGLHGEYVLILVDEASGVADKVFEVMKGALTGDNYIVGYWSNPTRNEGEFYQSHKPGSLYTKLHFSSRHSPIVKEGYIEKMEADYPSNGDQPSDEVLIRVDGEFAGTTVMDEKGWIPLFANVTIHFEPERGQIINGGVIAVDPAGAGKDSTSVGIRDNVYLKEVLHEKTSNPKDLARKVETIRDAYNCKSEDIGVEAFGVGAKLVANINTKLNDSVHALITGVPREGTEHLYNSWKTEMAWLFRQWLIAGGIIITNHKSAWMRELEKIKYKRDAKGRIVLIDKVMFKKEYAFSPDRFDMAIHTFFKAEASRPAVVTKNEREAKEAAEFMSKVMHSQASDDYSSL